MRPKSEPIISVNLSAIPAVSALVVPYRVSGDAVEATRAIVPDEVLPDMNTEPPGRCS